MAGLSCAPSLSAAHAGAWPRLAGPGLLVAVGYMDPGNWATDIAAGARFGPALLWVVVAASLAAMLLQTLSLRLGLVARLDLAQACRQRYSPRVNGALWLMAEIAIIACDVAEVLGGGLALHLLTGMSITQGIIATAALALLVLALQGSGLRRLEAIVLALVLVIGGCFVVELALARPDWRSIAGGLWPDTRMLHDERALLLAIGIVGATVMPHNLYLHGAVVQAHHAPAGGAALRRSLRLATWDTVLSLSLALLVNGAILTLAATVFHGSGHVGVADIQDAYHLLDPLLGGALAALLFGIALFAAGQSSTLTGTLAGLVILEGFLALRWPRWQRLAVTRSLALLPALGGVAWLGDAGVGTLLVLSQVVLCLQLPFAMWPLIRLNRDRAVMGEHACGALPGACAWLLFGIIVAANLTLLLTLV